MLSKRNRSGLVVVAVVLLLAAAAPAHAAGLGGLGSFWSWLASWTGLGEAGLAIVSSTGSSDSGPEIDPDGGNQLPFSGQSDKGPEIDPDGGNRLSPSTVQSDKGPLIDPNGTPR